VSPLDLLVERLLHSAVGHGNDLDFLSQYFRGEIRRYVKRIEGERDEARRDLEDSEP
jgi:hypothetical protein